MNITGLGIYEGEGCLPKALWRDGRFLSLDPTSRLLYIYLLTGIEFERSGIFPIGSESIGAAITLREDLVGQRMNVLADISLITWDWKVVWLHGVREAYLEVASPRAIQQMNKQVNLVDPDSPVLQGYREHFDLDAGETTATSDLHTAVALVTGQDILLFSERERNFCDTLNFAEYTDADILTAFGPLTGAWYRHDWRGRKGQLPTMKDISQNLKELLKKAGDPGQVTVDVDAVIKTVVALVAHDKGYGFAKAAIAEKYGDETWEKMMSYRGSWNTSWSDLPEGAIEWQVRKALKGTG